MEEIPLNNTRPQQTAGSPTASAGYFDVKPTTSAAPAAAVSGQQFTSATPAATTPISTLATPVNQAFATPRPVVQTQPLAGIAGSQTAPPKPPAPPPPGSFPQQSASLPKPPPNKKTRQKPKFRRLLAPLLAVLLLGGGLLVWNLMRQDQTGQVSSSKTTDAAERFDTLNIPLSELVKTGSVSFDGSRSLNINGQLRANNSLIINPSGRPSSAVAGQIYYDEATNELAYYNGADFVNLTSPTGEIVENIGGISGSVTVGAGLTAGGGQLANAGVLSFQGQTGEVALAGGDGLAVEGTTITNTGVLSVQGQIGNISFTAGDGIAVDGTTLTNTGVVSVGGETGELALGDGLAVADGTLEATGVQSLTAGTVNLTVTDDGSGNLTISSVGGGTGTVSSPGGTAGRIAKFTGAQTIEDSLLSESGTVVTVNGDLTVTGALNLSAPLAVSSGGTGAANPAGARTNLGAAASGANSDITSLTGLTTALSVIQGGTGVSTIPNNGIVIGQGTGAIATVTAGGPGLCLLSTAGAPNFQACPAGITSLNGLAGPALTIANATGSGSTITIDDASSSAKGIASFNATNFAVVSGNVNTVQNINAGATPTFAGINTNSVVASGGTLTVGSTSQNLVLQGASTTLTQTNGANLAALTFAAPTANVTYRLQTAAAGTYDVCTTAGNCVALGGAVTTLGGTTNQLARFTGSQTIGNSVISDDGALVTIAGDLQVTGTVTLDTPLAVTEGGTGAVDAAGARANLGAAASGANSDITSLSGLTTALSVVQGGTGAAALTSGGILIGNGTSPVSSLVPTLVGQCLLAGVSGPEWSTCPSSSVNSLNGLMGNLTIANASAAGSTITIDDASTSTKGIASFDSTNFTVSSGVVDTIQNINTGATPTFAAINTNSINPSAALTVGATSQDLTLQGANTLITATSGANTTSLSFAAPTANVTYRLQTAAAGTYDVCTTVGNCTGVGGGVTSPGGTTNQLAKFTGGQTIGDSLISDDGSLVTIAGNLQVTGTVTLTTPLAVTQGGTGAINAGGARTNLGAAASGANSDITSLSGLTTALSVVQGGTGATSLTADGVLLGNGTSAISSLAAGAPGQCLLSTAGAPTWSACPGGGGGGVTSLNGLGGVLTLANASGVGTTITIDDATTSTKGIASFNATNFTVTAGAVNTIQNIDATATPTFAGINTNSINPSAALTVGATSQNLTLQGAATTITSTNGANVAALSFVAPTANVTYRLQTAAAGTYDVCTTAGNCTGVGGGVTTPGGTTNQLAKFTGSQAIGDSIISDDGSLVTIAGDLEVTGIVTLTTPLAITEGGTGAINAGGARTNLGAAASGANSDITSLSGLTTALSVVQGGTGATSLTANGILLGNGTAAISSLAAGGPGQCLVSTAGAPTWTSCPGSGGVSSVNGLSGALTIANASGVGTTITIDDATTSTKGIASFNATNFSVTSGAVNTIQNINTTAAPTFGQLTLTSSQASAAMLVINNTNVSASGNLIDLQLNGASRFSVNPAGALTLSSTVNGQTISSSASFTGTLAVAGNSTLTGDLAVNGGDVTSTGALNITPGGTLTAGAIAQSFTLQGNASSTITATDSGNTTTLAFEVPTADVSYRLLAAAAGTYDICTTVGNCVGTGGGVTTTGGTINQLAKFTGGQAIGDSIISDNGTTVTVGGILSVNTITPTAALTIGATGHNLTLQGAITTITSTGAGNDIVLNSADTIELQDNTNITGALTVSGTTTSTGTINTSGGTIQTAGTTRIDNSGNLTNIGNLTLSGAISGGTTISGSGNINTSGGALQTAGTSRVDNSGNLVNIGNITGSGSVTIASTGAGNDVIINGADEFIVQDAATFNAAAVFNGTSTFNTDVDLTLADTENLNITSTVTGTNSVNLIGAVLTNNTSSGTQQVALLQNASGSGSTEGLLVLDNADADTAVTSGMQITSAAGGITNAIDVSDSDITTALLFGANDITGTNFSVTGSSGSFTSAGNGTLQGGTVTLGTASQAGGLVLNDGSSNTGTLQVAALGQNTTYILPDPGTGTVSICLTSGNCAGSGGGVTGTGTNNRLTKFTSTGSTIGDSSITDDGTSVTTTVDMVIQGGDLTIGTTSQLATLLLHDGNGQSTSLQAGDSSGNLTFILPTTAGATNQCLKQSGTGNQLVWDTCDGGGGGSSATLQGAYDNGNNITTTDARDIDIVLANTTTDSNFDIVVADGSTSFVSFTRANGAGTADPAQLLLIDNLDADRAIPAGIKLQSAGGGMTVAIDATDAEIVDALSVGANNIVGTTGNIDFANFDVVGSTGNVTAGTYNGQTISGTASFTGTLQVAGATTLQTTLAVTGNTTLTGDLAVNGGDITSSGALNVTPGGALTVGSATQDLTLQGNGTTTLTATDSGNTTTLSFATPSADATLRLPALGAGTYDICTTSGNCAGVGTTLQTAYNNSSNPEITLDATRGALTVRDASTPLGANLLEVQNNAGSTTYFAVSATGTTTTGTASATGNINTSGGSLQTGGTTRVDNSGNLVNIGNLTLSGAISGGTTYSGSGNINTTGGVLQTNSTTRVDNSGNLVDIGNITGTGAITIASTGAGNDIVINGADILDVQDAAVFTDTTTFNGVATFNTDVNMAFAESENLSITNTVTGITAVDLISTVLTNNSTSGTQRGVLVQNAAGTGTTESLLTLDNADADTAVTTGLQISAAAGGFTTAIDVSDSDIVTALNFGANNIVGTTGDIDMTNFDVAGSSGNVTAGTYNGQTISSAASLTGTLQVAGAVTLQSTLAVTGNSTLTGDLAVNGGDITSSGALNITPGGALTIGATGQSLTLQGNASTTLSANDSGNTTTIDFAVPTADTILRFPALAAGTYDICLSSGNCAGAGTTLQSAYNNSSSPEITVDATRGALTIRDASSAIGANLLEVQNNAGSTTYLAVTSGGISVTGTTSSTGNINSSGGALQTGGTTRVDNSGNLTNIGNIGLSGAISGGTTYSGSGNINTTGGALQTAGTTRVDNTGNLVNIGNLTLSGAISGGTTVTGSGNFNTTGGSLQTNSTTRVDNSGNLVNIGNITGAGAITVASSGAGNDIVINGADEFIIQDASVFNALSTFNTDVDLTLADTENLNITSTVTGTNSVNLIGAVLTNNTSSGTQQVAVLQNAASSGTTEGILVLDNADADTAVGNGLQITSAAGGITTALDVSDSDITTALLFGANDITGTNFSVAGSSGNVTGGTYNGQTISGTASFTGTLQVAGATTLQTTLAVTGNTTLTGDLAVNGGDITSSGALNITPGGALTVGAAGQILALQGNASSTLSATSGSNTTTLAFESPTADTTIELPALAAGTYQLCTSSGNCTGVATTLQTAYDGSTNPEIVLDATRGALTVRDAASPIGANLFEVQNNAGGTTYFAVTATGSATTGTSTATGNINSSGGDLQTAGTTRVDNSGNLTNIGTLTLSGAISGGTTFTGSGNINTTGGAIQTNSTSRIDNSGNLVNIGNITGTGAITIASTGAGNDIIINGADILDIQDATTFATTAAFNGVATFNTDVDLTHTAGENLAITNTVTGTTGVNAINVILTNNTTSGTQRGAVIQNAAGTGTTEALLVLDNADTDTAVTTALQITAAAGGVATAIDLTDSDIVDAINIGANNIVGTTGNIDLTNFDVVGGSGNTTVGGTLDVSSAATLSSTLGVTGTTTLSGDLAANGNTSIGNANTDTLTVTSVLQGTNALVFEGGTADANELTLAIDTLTGDQTITLPDETGTVCLRNSTSCGFALSGGSTAYIQNQNAGQQSSSNFWISGTGRADTALNAPVFDRADAGTLTIGGTNATAITLGDNTTVSGSLTAVGIDAGAGLLQGTAGLAVSGAVAQINVNSNFATNVNTGTSNGTITLGGGSAALVIDSTGLDVTSGGALSGITTITTSGAINGQTISSAANFTGTVDIAGNTDINGALDAAGATTLGSTLGVTGTTTLSGDLASNGNTTIGNAATDTLTVTSILQGASPLVFEGATVDANQLTLAVASLSGDHTVTLPDETGTVCLQSSASCGFVTGTAGSYIQNQNAGQQSSSNFWISGTGRADTALQSSLFDTAAAGTLAVGTTNATDIALNKATTVTGGLTQSGGRFSLTGSGSSSSLTTTSTSLNISAGAFSTWETTSGGLTVQTPSGQTMSLFAGTVLVGGASSTVVTLGSTNNARTINVGASGSSTAQAVNVGSTGSTSATTIRGGNGATAITLQTASGGTIGIGNAGVAGTVQVGNTTGAVAQTLNFGNNATASSTSTVTVGSLIGTSATNIQGGTGATALSLATGSGGTLRVASTGVANTVQIGNTTGAVAQTINIGNNATASSVTTLTVGSTVGTSETTIQGGTSSTAITLAPASGGSINLTTTGAGTNNITSATGTVVRSSTNVGTAFQIQDTSNAPLFIADTSNSFIINNGVGTANNLLENAGFEAGAVTTRASGWTFPGSYTINTDAANARSGNRVLVGAASSANIDASSTKEFAVQPGDTYYFEGWVKSAGGTNGEAGFYFAQMDKDKANPTFNAVSGDYIAAPGNTYTKISGTTTIASGKYYLTVAPSIRNTSTTGTWYFDDLVLRKTNSSGGASFSESSVTAFQVQSASGSQAMAIDTTSTNGNLITNPDFETDASGTLAKGIAPPARSTAQSQYGNASLETTTFTSPGQGARINGFTQTIAAGTYTFSFDMRLGSGTWTGTNIQVGYGTGADTNVCSYATPAEDVPTTAFRRYSCTFTSGSTVTSVYVAHADNTSRTFYLDGLRLEAGTANSPYQHSAVNLDGSVLRTSGSIFLDSNQTNNCTGVDFNLCGGLKFGYNASGEGISSNRSASNVSNYNGLDFYTNNARQFYLTNGGEAVFQDNSNSTTSFQVQNSAGDALLIADTSNSRLYVGPTAGNTTGPLLVLGTKTNTGDPTGVNGAMYYNEAMQQYRCFSSVSSTEADGAWAQCGINPIDRGFAIEDEFFGGSTSASNTNSGIGGSNWTSTRLGTTECSGLTYGGPSANRPGIMAINTGSATNTGCVLTLGSAGSASMTLAPANVVKMGVAPGSTIANSIFRVGIHNAITNTVGNPTTGVWWEADTSANANWRYCYVNAGPTVTCANSGTAVSASTFVSLEIRINALGSGTSSADFFINGTKTSISGITINTTNNVSPAMYCQTTTAASRTCTVDYYQLRGYSTTQR